MASSEKCLIHVIGTLLRLKGGTKTFEFSGKSVEGKIILKDPKTGITYLVKYEEIDWSPIINLKTF